MTTRGRLPRSWGDSPPDRLAGCTVALFKMIGFGFLVWLIFGAVVEFLASR